MSIHGALISTIRRLRGLTQAQLAEQISVDIGTISRWERGKRIPDVMQISDLYDSLGIRGIERSKASRLYIDGWKLDEESEFVKLEVVFRGLDMAEVISPGDREKAISKLIDIFYRECEETQ
jgi:transcriptional regulator with XRE-family HTH domain